MNALLNIARGYVIFMGASGFLFGQLFFGTFSFAASLAGVSGISAGVLSWRSIERQGVRPFVVLSCIAGVVGVALDALHYYSHLDAPGNYYAWFLNGPFVVALLLIRHSALARSA